MLQKGWDFGRADDLLGGTAQPHEGGQPVLAIGAHDQEIGLAAGSRRQDGTAARARRQAGTVEALQFRFNAVVFQVGHGHGRVAALL